jgi:hypothetical protein
MGAVGGRRPFRIGGFGAPTREPHVLLIRRDKRCLAHFARAYFGLLLSSNF